MGIRIRNAHILGEENTVRRDVYLEGNRIASIGAAPEGFREDTVIDASNRTLMPGLINAHTHAYMTLFRNFADDIPFGEWLFEKILPIEDRIDGEDSYWGDLLAFSEMLRTGTTSVIDMQMFPDTLLRASEESGMRVAVGRALVGEKRGEEGVVRRWNESLRAEAMAAEIGSSMQFFPSLHAIYSCGEDVLRYAAELSAERNSVLTLHLAESQKEYEDCLREHGKTPVQYIADLGLLEGEVLLAHCVYLSDEDYACLARPNVHVVTNPASNAKLANGIAPVAEMLRRGVNVCLGTDGAASDNTQNMFAAMRLVSLLQKAAERSSEVLPAKEVLRMATENGARAMKMGEELGRVEEGRIADLILIDENAMTFQPRYDMHAALVYSANGMEVTDTIVDGKIVMRNRELLTIDEERVRCEIARITADYH